MVRTADWKFCYEDNGQSRLFSVHGDPYEENNRINDPACAAIVAELQKRAIAGWNKPAPTKK